MKPILFFIIFSFMVIPTDSQANFGAGYCVGMSGKSHLRSELKKCKEESEQLKKEIQELKEKVKKLEEQGEAK